MTPSTLKRPLADPSGDQDHEPLSAVLEGWLESGTQRTVGELLTLFGEKSFAILFVLLLAVPALPLPTGGVTHVLELVAMLLALNLILGREEVWLPERWRAMELGTSSQERFLRGLIRLLAWLERRSRPRLSFLFGHSLANRVFGLAVLAGSLGAFLAPPFTGLDTLPALGVVVLSVGVLSEDFALAIAGIAIGAAGIALELVLGKAALSGLGNLF